MSFQKGDQLISIGTSSVTLRLTIGALAEINSRLGASGPQSLSGRLRRFTPSQGRELLACLMRPNSPLPGSADRSAALISDADIARAMPAICRLFEEAFSDG